jgi:hypothetical protein
MVRCSRSLQASTCDRCSSGFKRRARGTGAASVALDVAAVLKRAPRLESLPQEDAHHLRLGHRPAKVDHHALPEGAELAPKLPVGLEGDDARAVHARHMVARPRGSGLPGRCENSRKPLTTISRCGYRGGRG